MRASAVPVLLLLASLAAAQDLPTSSAGSPILVTSLAYEGIASSLGDVEQPVAPGALLPWFGDVRGAALLWGRDGDAPAAGLLTRSFLFSDFMVSQLTRFVMRDALALNVDGLNPDRAAWDAIPIPEPSAYGLAGGALLLAVAALRRRRSTKAN
jgi:hypothetical protein